MKKWFVSVVATIVALVGFAMSPSNAQAQTITWIGWNSVPNGGTTNLNNSVAVTVYNNRMYLFLIGTNGHVYVQSTSDGVSWSGYTEVPNNGVTNTQVAVAVYSGKLYLFLKGGSNGHVYLNVYNGSSWVGYTEVPGSGITGAPLACAASDRLYLYLTGQTNGRIYVNAYNGTSWTGYSAVPGGGLTNLGTSATFLNGTSDIGLFLIGTDSAVYNTNYDQYSGWYTGGYVGIDPSFSTDALVSATTYQSGTSYCVAAKITSDMPGNPAGIYANVGRYTWSGFTYVPYSSTTTAPAVVNFNGFVYLFEVTGSGTLQYNRGY